MLICKIKKDFKNFKLDVDFTMEDETLGFLGASGAGKSLTLKAIAGIIKPDSGQIILNDRVLFDSEKNINLKVQDRKVGFLFQDLALFPNFTVEENVRIGLRDGSQKDISEKLKEMQIYHIKDKYPKHISGGEKQRVALCRILVNQPDILILDEPFSALDEFLKQSIEIEVRKIIKKYKLKTILVTHNKDEAYRICDKIISISNGKSFKKKATDVFFKYPTNLTEAKLIGINNFSDYQIKAENEIYAKNWGLNFQLDSPPIGKICAVASNKLILSENKVGQNSFLLTNYELIENVDSYIIIFNQNKEKFDDFRIEVRKEDYNRLKDKRIFVSVLSDDLVFLERN